MNRFRYLGEPSILGKLGKGVAIPWYLAGGVARSSCVAAYQPMGAASLADSYKNLINPGTYDAAPGVAPTFNTATGWTFNGTTQYLVTGVVPSLNPNAWSAIIKYSNFENSARCLFGIFQTGAPNGIFTINNNLTTHLVGYRKNISGYFTSAPEVLAGVLGFNATKGFRNGAYDLTFTVTTANGNTLDVYIGGTNNGLTGTNLLKGKVQAFAIYNTSLSDAQMVAIELAMVALNP